VNRTTTMMTSLSTSAQRERAVNLDRIHQRATAP
jgi:hypothetical protein